MNCPKCGGEMWDETKSKFWNNGIDKKTGKAKPPFKCKDKDCGGTAGGASNGATGATTQPAPTAPAPLSVDRAADVWKIYKTFASKYCAEVVPLLKGAGVEVTHEGASAAIATMLIATNGNGKH
jgi:hypothetical protein